KDSYTISKLLAVRANVSAGGTRLSGTAVGKRALERIVSLLASILLDKTFDGSALEMQPEEGASAYEEHVETCKGCQRFHLLDDEKETTTVGETGELICPTPTDSGHNN
ncbi:MAG: hypothetical protein ACRD2L_24095, partial [Terriglobia bacterium]